MNIRAEFEEWWSENMFIGGKCFADEQTKRRCFRAWQASRAAIEVELPEKISPYNKDAAGFVGIAAVGYDEAIDDCGDALAIAGLKYRFGAKPTDELPLQHEAKEE